MGHTDCQLGEGKWGGAGTGSRSLDIKMIVSSLLFVIVSSSLLHSLITTSSLKRKILCNMNTHVTTIPWKSPGHCFSIFLKKSWHYMSWSWERIYWTRLDVFYFNGSVMSLMISIPQALQDHTTKVVVQASFLHQLPPTHWSFALRRQFKIICCKIEIIFSGPLS